MLGTSCPSRGSLKPHQDRIKAASGPFRTAPQDRIKTASGPFRTATQDRVKSAPGPELEDNMILALYGAGAMGREFLEIAKEQGTWSDIVFIDDNAAEETVSGAKVYSFQAFHNRFTADQVRFVISIGEPKYRLEAYEHMKQAGYIGGLLVHPEFYVAPDAEIGEGAALCFGSFVGSKARIGCNFYASVRASIGHDSVIGDHTRVGAGAFIGGHTTVGNNSFIGSGAMLKDRIRVGSGCVVALGAAVFSNVPDGATVVGNPARVVKSLDEYLNKEKERMKGDNVFGEEYTLRNPNFGEVERSQMLKAVKEEGCLFVK